MSQFNITFQQMQSAIDQLNEQNSKLKSATDYLVDTETSLCGMWEGAARDKFDSEFKKDKVQMDSFYAEIGKYITVLQNALQQYMQAEQANTEIASNRTYH
ncbi:hypothetical protein OBV_34230 [Oscillibacter valericigenes Sjm18-20]|nr:hypothetical protein OBV_34230 [Oscillibacter valericigenes Sjm18-20]